jgi:predicted component of type VI protein secretion system
MSLSGAPLGVPLFAEFGDAGGDIGRGADCTLILPDPERRISRRQALITCRDGRYCIRQVGTNLAIEIDGVPLALDVDFPLTAGAQIRIGAYLLRAEYTSSHKADLPLPTDAPVIVDDEPLAADDPLSAEVDLIVGDPTGFEQRPAPNASLSAQGAQGVQSLSVPELFAALYSGLGLPTPAPADQTAQALHHIGALLRNSIEGTLSLLAARSIAKRELGANMTLPQPRENNPLKFAPDLDTALAHLLRPALRGFMPPLAAVTDAFDDLRAHELALLAGMRAVLIDIVSRFDPASLGSGVASHSAWENLLPGSREAKLWAQFCERYAEIARDVEGVGDFDTLFSRAFRDAYEKQLAELVQSSSRSV